MGARLRQSREGFYRLITTSVLGFFDCLYRVLQLMCLLTSGTTSIGPGPPKRFQNVRFKLGTSVTIIISVIAVTLIKHYPTMAPSTPYNVDHSSLEGIRFFFGRNLNPNYHYLQPSMNAAFASSFSETQINALYQDGAAKQTLNPNAFKKLQEAAIALISDKAILTTDKTDLKTKLLANMFFWKDNGGIEHGIRNHVELGKAMKKHLEKPLTTLEFYENEFVFFISTMMLFPDRDDDLIDVRDFSKINKELPPRPSSAVTPNATLLTIEKGLKDLSIEIVKGMNTGTNTVSGTGTGTPATASTASSNASSNVLNEKNLPLDVRTRWKAKMDSTTIRLSKDRVQYKNDLTICSSSGMKQSRNFVEFPLSTKTYLFCLDGSMFSHLKFQDNSQRKAFLTNITPLDGTDAMAWNRWCLITESLCMSLRVFILPFDCHDVCDTEPRGFIVADPETNLDAHIGSDYITYINDWDQQLYQAMSKKGIFPEGSIFEDALKMHVNQGYMVLRQIHGIFHPNLIRIPTSICSVIPKQNKSTYENYVARVQFDHQMKGFVMNVLSSFDERNTQDIFITGLDRSADVFDLIKDERESSAFANKYSKGQFIQTIGQKVSQLSPPKATIATVPRHYGNKPTNSNSYNNRPRSNYKRTTNSVSTEPTFADVNGLAGDVFSATGNEDDLNMLCEAICAISSDLNRFDSKTKPCALCKKTGHTFEGCEQLQDPVIIRQHYIKLRLAFQRLRSVADQANVKDLNELRLFTINSLETMMSQQIHGVSSYPSSGGSYPSYQGGIQSVNAMYGAPVHPTFPLNQMMIQQQPTFPINGVYGNSFGQQAFGPQPPPFQWNHANLHLLRNGPPGGATDDGSTSSRDSMGGRTDSSLEDNQNFRSGGS